MATYHCVRCDREIGASPFRLSCPTCDERLVTAGRKTGRAGEKPGGDGKG